MSGKFHKILFFLTILIFSSINYSFAQELLEEELEYPVVPEFDEQNYGRTVLKLEDNTILERGFLKLDCEWDYFENSNFISPEVVYPENKLTFFEESDEHVCRLPKIFTEGSNYASFHCRVTGLKPNTVYGMNIYRKIFSSSRIWCNGKLAASQGWVSKEEFDSRPQQRSKIVELSSDDDGVLDILIHVSNFTMNHGGIVKMLTITEHSHLIKVYAINIFIELFIAGLLLSVLIYNLIIFLSNKKQYLYFSLALLAFGFMVSDLTAGFSIINLMFPNIPYAIEYKLYMLAVFFMMPVHVVYICGLYSIKITRMLWMVFIGIACFIITILMPIQIYQKYVAFILSSIYTAMMIPVYYMVVFMHRRITFRGIRILENLFVYGSNIVLIFLLAFSNIYYQYFFTELDFGYVKCFWYKIIILLFCLTQALITALRRELISRKVERISIKMKKSNESLSKYLPKSLMRMMNITDMTDIVLGENIALESMILSAGILNFADISENLTYKERINIIDRFYEIAIPVIREHEGIVFRITDKGLVAIFPKCNDAVCEVSLMIQNKLKTLKKELRKEGMPDINLGIGIHMQKVAVGILGVETRYHPAVLSSGIAYTEKIRNQNKKLNSSILITEEAMPYCRTYNDCLMDGRFVTIKGKAVLVYSLSQQVPEKYSEQTMELGNV